MKEDVYVPIVVMPRSVAVSYSKDMRDPSSDSWADESIGGGRVSRGSGIVKVALPVR
jgi:hypothetical protein